MMKRLFLLPLLLLGACVSAPADQQAPATAATTLQVGAVSTADPRASAAGMEILRSGGSASDAAAAVMLALTVVEPQSSGIGGGGFLLYHDQERRTLTSYDGREEAPSAADPRWFLDPQGRPLPFSQAVPGGRSVGVPGNLRLIALAHERHGRLDWARLFDPAIRLARDGFQITPRLHRALSSERSLARLSPAGRALYYRPDGTPQPVGTTIRVPALADLYERIAARGPEVFYHGPAAQSLVAAVARAERNPAPMSLGDLATYEAKERPVPCGTYRGHRICGMGPPSSGATAVFAILKQLERFDLARLGPDSPAAWHLIVESMRLAYADRDQYVGDPDHVAVPVAGMMDEDYLAERSRLISPDQAIARVVPGRPPGAEARSAGVTAEVPSTSHFVVIDRAGNAASYTSTIEGPFGSGLMANGHFLNNELTDFSFVPEKGGEPVANRVEGGKRPRSSMSPTIVYGPDGRIRVALGAAGGTTIIAQVAKAIIAMIDWKMSAQEAIALPLLIGLGDQVLIEQGSAAARFEAPLRALGHRTMMRPASFKANAVEQVGPIWRGGADSRSEGVALVD